MSAQILDGKALRDEIAEELKAEIEKLDQKPELVIFQVGDVAQSNTYIGQKIKFGEKIGAIVTHKKLPADAAQAELIQEIQLANENENVSGIIVQLPIPKEMDKDEIIETIDPKKDVDGQTARNIKLLVEGNTQTQNQMSFPRKRESSSSLRETSSLISGFSIKSRMTDSSDSGQVEDPEHRRASKTEFQGFVPATTKGILTLLAHYKIPVEGKHVVVVGRSTLVGKPTALAFLNADATVTIAHRKTQNLAAVCKTADILVCAVGKVNLITKEHVKEEQVVVDVGINVVSELHSRSELSNDQAHSGSVAESRKLVGDVDFEAVKDIVAAISPVPGGAGPMTVASLFQNLLQAYKLQNAQ